MGGRDRVAVGGDADHHPRRVHRDARARARGRRHLPRPHPDHLGRPRLLRGSTTTTTVLPLTASELGAARTPRHAWAACWLACCGGVSAILIGRAWAGMLRRVASGLLAGSRASLPLV